MYGLGTSEGVFSKDDANCCSSKPCKRKKRL